ncbi:MAG TPA: AraC family transcriptional regulator [Kofleriaceae bacterium]|nr:AraC family transcriptional regulator [Kofleriaceae bacterium]
MRRPARIQAPDELPIHLRLRDLAGDERPIAAFEFDWRSPSYGGRLASADFTAIVLHRGGPSIAWHGQLIELDAGDVHVVPAGTAHRIYDFGTAAGIAIAFLPPMLDDARQLAAALRAVPTPNRIGRQGLGKLEPLAHRMVDESRTQALGSADVLRGLLFCMIADVCRLAGVSAREAPRSAAVSGALAFIERSYARPISLRDVGKAVALSPRHLATRVRGETGRSVGDWITTFRLARARTLLRSTELPIEDIAVEVGWSDPTHFIRTFAREEGRTPSAFRRAIAGAQARS